MSDKSQESITIGIEDEQLVIRVGVDCLCGAVQMADTWPMNCDGETAKIVNQPQFLLDLIAELGRDDEQGATPLHRAFDEAASEVLEGGYESVELMDDSEE